MVTGWGRGTVPLGALIDPLSKPMIFGIAANVDCKSRTIQPLCAHVPRSQSRGLLLTVGQTRAPRAPRPEQHTCVRRLGPELG